MFRIVASGLLALIPIPALAFPVVVGSLTQSLLLILFLGAGASGYAAKKSKRLLVGCVCLALTVAAYIISTNIAVNALSMKASQFQTETYDKSKPITKLIDINTAKTLIEQQGFVAIQVSDKPMPSIKGLNSFSPEHSVKAGLYAKERSATGIVLFSNYISPAIDLAQRLPEFQENAFIVPTSQGTQYKDGTITSHAYIDEFFNTQNQLGIPLALPFEKVSEEPLYLFNQTKAELLSNYNVIVAGGDDLLKTYISYGSKAASIPHLLMMNDTEWKKMANGFDADKPTVVTFTEALNKRHKDLISAHILTKLKKHISIDALTYTLSADFVSVLPPLPTDNYITPYHHNADRHMLPTTFYAVQRHHGELTTLCFTKNCTDRLPPHSSSFGTTLVDLDSVFSFENYQLMVDTTSIDRSKPIAITLEDASTSLLGYFLAHQLTMDGYQFVGFTNLYGGLFGGAYNNPLGKGTDSEFYYDDIRVRIDVALQELLLSTTPEKPIQIEGSFWLVALGAVLGLLISIQSLPKKVRHSAMCIAAYFSLYGHLWVQAPIADYQMGILPNIVMAFTLAAIMTLSPERTIDRRGVKLMLLINTLVCFVLVTLAFMPIIDRFYYGIALSMLLVLIVSLYSFKIPNTIGAKYKLTAPFVTGFKGYLVEADKRIPYPCLIPSKKWIIRSNHISDMESEAGGFFESIVEKRSDVNQAIAVLTNSATNRHKLTKDQIQFWVMPFEEYVMTGCAESHYGGFSLKVAMAIDEDREAVTSGTSSNFTLFERNNNHLNLTERRVLAALKKIESRLDSPVSIEFGFTKTCQLEVLQVRKLKLHPSADPSALAVWRNSAKKMVKIDQQPLSPLSKSVLHHLYAKSVVASDEAIWRHQHKLNPFDADQLMKVLAELKLIAGNKRLITNGSFSLLVEQISYAVHPAAIMRTDDENADVWKWFLEAANVVELSQQLCDEVGGIPESLELSDKSEPSESFITRGGSLSQRDAVRSVMLYAIAIIKMSATKQSVCNSVSMEGLSNGHRNVAILSDVDTEKGKTEIVVVEGKMPSKTCTLDELLLTPTDELKNITLVCDYVPNSKMKMISSLGGLVCHTGTPLSHAAITAKFFEVPMVIKPKSPKK